MFDKIRQIGSDTAARECIEFFADGVRDVRAQFTRKMLCQSVNDLTHGPVVLRSVHDASMCLGGPVVNTEARSET